MPDTILRFAKAHVALVGAVATYVVATYPTGTLAHIAAVVLAVLTALGVAVVPNKPAPKVKPAKAVYRFKGVDAGAGKAFDKVAKAKKDAGLSLVEAIVAIAVAGFVLWLILRHVH